MCGKPAVEFRVGTRVAYTYIYIFIVMYSCYYFVIVLIIISFLFRFTTVETAAFANVRDEMMRDENNKEHSSFPATVEKGE